MALVSLLFFISGCAALLFETVWFRQAGLALGNSVQSSSLILAGFMAGLGLGNGVAAAWDARLRRPLRTYAALEVGVGLTGLGVAWLLPVLTPLLSRLLGDLAPGGALLATLRFGGSLLLLLVPAGCMGATLPVLTRALGRVEPNFGRALGWLYGWNTLGAMAGALLGETVLVGRLGVRGTALFACVLDLCAAAAVLRLARRQEVTAAPPRETGPSVPRPPRAAAAGLLLATAACGATLLALEVLWFRFMLLWCDAGSLVFALMLAVVLAGLGLGGLVAAAWLRRDPQACRAAALPAALASVTCALGYFGFGRVRDLAPGAMTSDPGAILVLALALMLPTSFLSGVLFPLVGKAVADRWRTDVAAAAGLTLANTLGAGVGALGGGLLLLPVAGVERGFFAMSLSYLSIAGLLAWELRPSGRDALALAALAALGAAALVWFPFGLMANSYVPRVVSPWAGPEVSTLAVREGLSETAVQLETRFLGTPVAHRLVTNSFSMSASGVTGQRYMKLFVHLPMALRATLREALLICFGVGNTARALADTPWLERIDVVDVSRDILDLGRLVFPRGRFPLDDPRVAVHVEDGRHFLATTRQRYDLITAEPPPPKHAGVVNLYSLEHFRLVRSRLREGGQCSYWLPAAQLSPQDRRAVVRAFCEAFPDCSLWSGAGPEWILLGSVGRSEPPTEDQFVRQWRSAGLAQALTETGLEGPEQLGATFLADAGQIRAWAGDTPPVTDEFPQRLSPQPVRELDLEPIEMARQGGRAFAESEFVRRVWPPGMREQTLASLPIQQIVLAALWEAYGAGPVSLEGLHELLTRSTYRVPVLWLTGSDPRLVEAASLARAQGRDQPASWEHEASARLSERRYAEAARLLALAEPTSRRPERLRLWRTLCLALEGRRDAADEAWEALSRRPGTASPSDLAWLASRFGLGATARPRVDSTPGRR